MVAFFETAAKYFTWLPTYEWLEDKKITPSNETGYSLTDIQGALSEKYGAVPYVGCSGKRYNETDAGKGSQDGGRTVLSEVWYFSWVSALFLFALCRIGCCSGGWVRGLKQSANSVLQANGRPQDQTAETIVKVNSTTKSTCAKADGAVMYYERAEGSERAH